MAVQGAGLKLEQLVIQAIGLMKWRVRFPLRLCCRISKLLIVTIEIVCRVCQASKTEMMKTQLVFGPLIVPKN